MFSYILFDLDGTVSDPKAGITGSVQYALHALGIEEPDLDRLEPFIGPPLRDSFQEYYNLNEEQTEFAVKKYRERFCAKGIYENILYPGMKELLNRLKEEMGLTILFIAHNLSVVKYFSDRIGVMYYGKLVEMADSDELFKNPMHPYTRALLSAIPEPDPINEKKRKKIHYDPEMHRYGDGNQPSYHEIAPGHTVYCSDEEFEEIKKQWKA